MEFMTLLVIIEFIYYKIKADTDTDSIAGNDSGWYGHGFEQWRS